MIPILYPQNSTVFTDNGLGRLTDCTRFIVTEERNGIYEAEFDYPINGHKFDDIKVGCIVYATHDDSKTPQPFEIYSRTAPLEGVCTYRAWHISYRLNNVILKPYTAATCSAALAAMPGNSINDNQFTFWTNKVVTGTFSVTVPKSVREALGGSEGSILDTYGKGDYEFDGFTVRLWTNRGTDRGVSIRYAKNLASLEQQRDISNQVNAYVPYWQGGDDDVVVYLDHAIIGNMVTTDGVLEERDHQTINTNNDEAIDVRYGTVRTVPLDLSDYFEDQPTEQDLEARATALLSGSDSYEIKENVRVDFVPDELQVVRLCDTVHIYYERLGINATAKCIKTVYDTLRERYQAAEFGAPSTTLSDQISGLVGAETKKLPTRTTMYDAIQKATALISGGFGGYIKYNYLEDGTPSEMLIMDNPDEASATNIIRLNQNGLGFSTDGGATYANAWTIDGQLNADYIQTGTLRGLQLIGNIISGGTITSQGTYTSGWTGTTTINSGTFQSVGTSGTITDTLTAEATGIKLVSVDSDGDFTEMVEIWADSLYGSVIRITGWDGSKTTITPKYIRVNDRDILELH